MSTVLCKSCKANNLKLYNWKFSIFYLASSINDVTLFFSSLPPLHLTLHPYKKFPSTISAWHHLWTKPTYKYDLFVGLLSYIILHLIFLIYWAVINSWKVGNAHLSLVYLLVLPPLSNFLSRSWGSSDSRCRLLPPGGSFVPNEKWNSKHKKKLFCN